MKIISWNIRGLNGTHKQEIMRNLIRDQRPDILMIQETKMKKDFLGKIMFSNLMSGEASDSDGSSRGLLTLFNTKIFRMKYSYNEGNILLCKVFHIPSNDSRFLLNLYAPNNKRERNNYWTRAQSLVQSRNLKKGIIMGDFNTPLLDEEKKGGLPPDWESKNDLSNFINGLAFLDMDLMEEPLLGQINALVRNVFRLDWTELLSLLTSYSLPLRAS